MASTDSDKTSPQKHLWRALHLLNAYRLLLTAFFLGSYWLTDTPHPLGDTLPQTFLGGTLGYLIIGLLALLTHQWRKPALNTQLIVYTCADITLITLLMHASGGVGSGLGMLLIVYLAGAGLLVGGRTALTLAATAAWAMLLEHWLAVVYWNGDMQLFTQTGMLGGAFFGTAILASTLAKRLRESEALAEQRGIDLANMAQLNEHIIQHMGSGVIVVDGHKQVRLVNESAWYLLGMPIKKTSKQKLSALSEQLAEQLQRWQDNPQFKPQAFRNRGTADLYPRFTRLGDGPQAGTLITLEDSQLMQEQAQHDKLSALGRLTASIAHEIRNPLGAVSHATQLLEESDQLNKADRRLAEIIRQHSVRMNSIIENVMQLSRRDHAEPKQILLKEWLPTFLDEFCRSHDLRTEQIRVILEPENVAVYIDEDHLHQILANLCENALKHGGEHGEHAFHLQAGISRESQGPVLDVIDFGPGIDPETASHIFEPFYTTKTSGSGLGLYIAKELSDANRAHLQYLAIPTGGSCFRISFFNPKQKHD